MGFNSGFKGLIKLEIYQHIFEKSSDTHFHENPSGGSRVLCGQTDRQTAQTRPEHTSSYAARWNKRKVEPCNKQCCSQFR